MYFRKKQSEGRIYLQIVESARDGEKVRQHVIATLGRLDELESSGQLERLLKSGARFAQEAMVVAASRNGEAAQVAVRRIGPALVFERLWEETGIKGVLESFAA
ncbi:MAG: transposase, partial [Alphaproteobacteria bacterium]|nr:transposase [Alphaproteobacteria bacterium]